MSSGRAPLEPSDKSANRRLASLLTVGIILLGALPPVFWWWAVARVPTVDIAEALTHFPNTSIVSGTGSGGTATETGDPCGTDWLLVDLRKPDSFKARHLSGALNLPFDELMSSPSKGALPSALQSRRLLVICDSGVLSARAVRHLNKIGQDAISLEGGLKTWGAAITPPPPGEIAPTDPKDQNTQGITFREATAFEQFIAVQGGFTIKPIYMLLSLVLIWVLRKEKVADLKALRWSMIFFFLGEFFCYLNFFVFKDGSHLFEYLHSYGMVLAAAFGFYALFDGMDRRLVHFSAADERCAAATLCKPCAKHTTAPCAFKRLFHFLIPAVMVLALLPLAVDPEVVCYNTRIWGTLYNYHHPLVYQFYELRACPLFALALAIVSWLVLLFKKSEPVRGAKLWFSAALGFLAFGIFRLLVYAPFTGELVWFEFWEEVTELLTIAAVIVTLWAFRRGLWPE